VQTPTLTFPVLNHFANIVMMPNQHAFPFFQQQTPQNQLLDAKPILVFSEPDNIYRQNHAIPKVNFLKSYQLTHCVFGAKPERDSHSIPAQTILYFAVYSRAPYSSACVPKMHDPPVLQVSTHYLRVAGQNIEWNFGLRGVEFSDEVQQAFSYSDALIVWKNNKPCYTKTSDLHMNMNNRNKCNRSILDMTTG